MEWVGTGQLVLMRGMRRVGNDKPEVSVSETYDKLQSTSAHSRINIHKTFIIKTLSYLIFKNSICILNIYNPQRHKQTHREKISHTQINKHTQTRTDSYTQTHTHSHTLLHTTCPMCRCSAQDSWTPLCINGGKKQCFL